MEDVDELISDYGDAEEYEDGDANSFKIRNPLSQPSAKMYSMEELHSLIHSGEVDLNPPYQRDVVWPEKKQIALIDSIFRNYYVPPILFQITDDDSGEPIRVCMDGKQRLTSIQKFFDGQIPHRDSVTKKKWWFITSKSQAASRLVIPDEYKKIFSQKTIPCVEYHGLGVEVERDIFQRVQMGVTLTAAEKLQAIDSVWSPFIMELDAKFISIDDGLTSVIHWDTKRGRDFQCLSQLLFCCESLPERSAPTAPKLEQWLIGRTEPPTPLYKRQMNDVLGTFWSIASDVKLQAGFKSVKQRVSPVEFVFIGVLIAALLGCSEEILSDEVLSLRERVRSNHRDVRANTRVMNTMWDYIEEARERYPRNALRWGRDVENFTVYEKPPPRRKRKQGDHAMEVDPPSTANRKRRTIIKA